MLLEGLSERFGNGIVGILMSSFAFTVTSSAATCKHINIFRERVGVGNFTRVVRNFTAIVRNFTAIVRDLTVGTLKKR